MLANSSVISATSNQVSSDLAGEAVILNLKSGTYFGLNEVGAGIWALLQEPRTVSEVRDALLAEYEVDADQCDRELMALLEDLAAAGLIEVNNETAT